MRTKVAAYLLAAALLCAATTSCSIFRKNPASAPAKTVRTTRTTTAIKNKKTDKTLPETVKVKRTEKPASPVHKKSEAEILADSLVAYSKSYLGVKYKYAGSSPSGFDCSGFVVFVYSHFGIFVPRTSSSQYMSSEHINVSDIRPGDLAFFNGRHAGGKDVGHVAIITEVLGDGKYRMIHSTIQKGVMIDNFPEGSYYPPRLVGYGRVIPEK